jgi:hypothetical protein
LFLCKRARSDIQPAIAFLTTGIKGPNQGDQFKVKNMMSFLKQTQEEIIMLEADNIGIITWHLDATFAVRPDYKGHTGVTMTLVKSAIQSTSTKQKVNGSSSTEAELVSMDDIVAKF